MAKYLSNRQKNLRIGISSYTENKTVLEVIGKVGIGTTNTNDASLYVVGLVTATEYYGEGGNLTLGMPPDGSLVTPGALNTFTTKTKLVESIDDLNELAYNIIHNTAVTSVDFTGTPTFGGSPLSVGLAITYSGSANVYDIDWGDGNITLGSTLLNNNHTYTNSLGGLFNVYVLARNSNGLGAGSSYATLKTNYITLYTPNPVVNYTIYPSNSGGSSINYWNDGTAIYLENITTNTVGYAVTYTINWGDGNLYEVSSDSVPGGVGGGRTTHTYTNPSETDRIYTITETLNSHPGADPAVIPSDISKEYKVYSTHSPTFTSSESIGINKSAFSGFAVTFTNNTENTIGTYTSFGIQYQWTWGNGTSIINVGSGIPGDTGLSTNRTFSLSPENQAVGIGSTYAVNLKVISNHTSSPFISTDFTITVEPEVRSIFTGVSTVYSDGLLDNVRVLYVGTDIFGINRRVGIFTNTSQNATTYNYSWGDGSSDDTIPNNVSAGGTTTPIYHTFQGSSGTKTVTLTANGTPGTIVQSGITSTVQMILKDIPTAPTSISASSLTLSSASQGVSPKLCAGATINVGGVGISTGSDVIRYATTTPIITNTINNVNSSVSGSVRALLNNVGIGTTTFTTSTNEIGTFSSLIISSEGDAHTQISATTYPTGFYQVFSTYITKALSEISIGVNDFGISHSSIGTCGFTTFVKDNLNTVPSVTAGILSETSGGTKRYISGIPLYNNGSPIITLSLSEVTNFTGQTYQNTSTPVNIAVDTNYESTSGNVITSTQNYTYLQVSQSGISSFIDSTSGVPIANTGVGYAYTFTSLPIPLTSTSIRSVQTLKIRASNSIGSGSYSTNSTKVQIHTASQSGISEISIAVASGLGNGTYTDNGKRIFDFNSATTDTPSYNGATNFYTNNPYTESSDPGVQGTKEATIRFGTLKYDATNYSTGYLPVGPNRSGDTGTQYFTFAFRRQVVANFDINITSSTGIAGLWIASPGTSIDSTSGLNGWLKSDTPYAGSGVPGSGVGGNGSDGCSYNTGDRILTSTALSGGYTMTLGSENMSNATGNVVLIRIALTSGQSITSLSIGAAVL